MIQNILNQYKKLNQLYNLRTIKQKALCLHRAFCDCCIETTNISRTIDNKIPLALTHKKISTPKVKTCNLDGFKILHLSDLHFSGDPRAPERLAKVIQGLNVDLVALTGDYHKGLNRKDLNELVVNQIAQSLKNVYSRHGIWAICGNHDNSDMKQAFEKNKIKFLHNHTHLIQTDSYSLTISGVDNENHYKVKKSNTYPARTNPRHQFGILLMHTPYEAQRAAHHGFDLYLTGHTHGPQIPLAALRRLAIGVNQSSDKASGLWREGSMIGHTSNGVGTSLYPIRIKSPAEVTLLTLKS